MELPGSLENKLDLLRKRVLDLNVSCVDGVFGVRDDYLSFVSLVCTGFLSDYDIVWLCCALLAVLLQWLPLVMWKAHEWKQEEDKKATDPDASSQPMTPRSVEPNPLQLALYPRRSDSFSKGPAFVPPTPPMLPYYDSFDPVDRTSMDQRQSNSFDYPPGYEMIYPMQTYRESPRYFDSFDQYDQRHRNPFPFPPGVHSIEPPSTTTAQFVALNPETVSYWNGPDTAMT
eukprot:756670-Hanusia_phi.AAC.14